MAWTTERYERVPWTAIKRLPCPSCDRKVRRQRTFEQTLNPFNTNAEGEPKTRREILAELREQAETWQREPVLCTPCADTAGEAGERDA